MGYCTSGLWATSSPFFEDELNDLLHMDDMSALAKSVCFNNMWATHEHLVAAYDSLPVPDRKLLIRSLRKWRASKMWKQGRRPTAIGLAIVLLNIERRHTPGESAAAVLQRTNAIIMAASE
jgi:hypothetical protein